MFESLSNFFERKAAPPAGPLTPEPLPNRPPLRREPAERKPTFSKAFRWRLPNGQTTAPTSVEVVGTFTQWQKVPLTRDSALDAWQVIIQHIQGHRTHHYMILVDGKPAYDKNCDGMAIPHGPEEEQYQIMTDKGPRVFMLFAQTK
jgi:hypothetical protein